MRITKVEIPKDLIDNGLEHVKMDKLGQIVLLAGKNGSGKTRLLDLIFNEIAKKPKKNDINLLEDEILKLKKKINFIPFTIDPILGQKSFVLNLKNVMMMKFFKVLENISIL